MKPACQCHCVTDVAVKRQLSSLLYVKGVCEKRIQQLHDGLDEPDLLPVVGGSTGQTKLGGVGHCAQDSTH